MYCLNMLAIAMELAQREPGLRGRGQQVLGALPLHRARDEQPRRAAASSLWDEEDGFFYDVLHLPDGQRTPLKVRSMVGLIPLFAVETLEPELLDRLPAFKRRLEWFIENRPDLTEHVASHAHARARRAPAAGDRRSRPAAPGPEGDARRAEFLSPYGIRVAVAAPSATSRTRCVVNGHEHA